MARSAGSTQTDDPPPRKLVKLNGLIGAIEVTLDENGRASFTISSEGILDQFLPEGTRAAKLGVRVTINHEGITATVTTPFGVVDEILIAHVQDVVTKFLGGALLGTGDDPAAIAGDLVLSLIPLIGGWSDLRDAVTELCRLWPGGQDPDGLVLTFTIVGLIAEVAPPLDAVLDVVRVVVKNVKDPLRGAIFRSVKEAAEEGIEALGACLPGGSGLRVAMPESYASAIGSGLHLRRARVTGLAFGTASVSTSAEAKCLFDYIEALYPPQRVLDYIDNKLFRRGGQAAVDNIDNVVNTLGKSRSNELLEHLSRKNASGDWVIDPERGLVVMERLGKMDAADLQALDGFGKLEIVADAIAKANWDGKALENYKKSVEALGPNRPVVKALDKYATVPGSDYFAKMGPTALNKIPARFELSTAEYFENLGAKIKRFNVGGESKLDVDIETDSHAIQAKSGKPPRSSKKDRDRAVD